MNQRRCLSNCACVLVKPFNLIYQIGTIPKQWLQLTLVTIPIKYNAITRSEHRTTALMSHTLKTVLKIMQGRVVKTLEYEVNDT